MKSISQIMILMQENSHILFKIVKITQYNYSILLLNICGQNMAIDFQNSKKNTTAFCILIIYVYVVWTYINNTWKNMCMHVHLSAGIMQLSCDAFVCVFACTLRVSV